MHRALCLLLAISLPACIPSLPPGPGAEDPSFRLPALHAEPDPLAGGRIVDALGREVLLRGVNVNAFVEYWAYDPGLFTTYPFTEADADAIAAIGWNVVRLLMSWSRIEPEPGVYDEAYLDAVEAAVLLLESRGIDSIIDLHQDAWSAALASRPDEDCSAFGNLPAFGWDGAPAWATLDGGAARCQVGIRELSPAVVASFRAFFSDAPGPGGVGIRTRYVRMLRHVAARFSPHGAVIGYDVMNEPNAIFVDQLQPLSDLYGAAIEEIRAGEADAGAPRRLVFIEPSISWAGNETFPVLPPFARDDQIVYAPHLYQGGLDPGPLSAAAFERARSDAALLGGAPVLSGEWGSDPGRAADPEDGYFALHQALQDEFRIGATLWTWREACGDPHKAGEVRSGQVPSVWGLFEVDCTTNSITAPREALRSALQRPLLRAAPAPIGRVAWDPDAARFEAEGPTADRDQTLLVFVPAARRPPEILDRTGLRSVLLTRTYGNAYFAVAWAEGGPWHLALRPR
jgi:endoglycosylceramidase